MQSLAEGVAPAMPQKTVAGGQKQGWLPAKIQPCLEMNKVTGD